MPPLKISIEVKDERKSLKRSLTFSKKRKSGGRDYASDELKPDWKIYVSDKFGEPNETNALYTFTNQHRLTIEPKGAGIFKKREQQNEFNSSTMYFNFSSTKGVTIKITARFPREEEDEDAKKKKFIPGT